MGLDDLRHPDGTRRMAGLCNVVVFGRAVTNVAQTLRSTEPTFDDWYAPWQREMSSDPLLKYFYKLRSEILKVGTLPGRGRELASMLRIPEDLARFGPPPPGATSFFIGDPTGGSGWYVEQPDGIVLKYYVALPDDIEVKTYLEGAPSIHLGKPIPDPTMESLCQAYYDYLYGFVKAAISHFGAGKAS